MFEWFADRYWRWKRARERRTEYAWERAARARGLFPAYGDLGGFMAVDRSGVVWCSETGDAWAAAARVSEPDIRFAALGVAVARHPQLADVAPVRRPEDPTCPTCLGRGSPAVVPPRLRHRIICQCGGLGWVPIALAHTVPNPEPPGSSAPVA